MSRRLTAAITVGYIHHRTLDEDRRAKEQRLLHLYCRRASRSLSEIFVDQGAERGGRELALAAVRGVGDGLLIVPALSHLTRCDEEFVRLLAEHFFGLDQPAIVALRDSFDSRTTQARMRVEILRAIQRPGVELPPLGATLH